MDTLPILAKPSGVTLAQHTADVMSEASDICQRLLVSCSKYKLFIGKNLKKRVEKVAQVHDVGKEYGGWQEACRNDYFDYKNWLANHPNGDFKIYSNDVGLKAGMNIRKCGVRHEFHSLPKGEKIKLPLPLMAAIASHHSKLGYEYKERWEREGFKKYWNDFAMESNSMIEEENFHLLSQKSYEYNGIRGLLELADHRASAKEEGEAVKEITCFSYHFPFPQKRGVQALMEEHWQEDILLVRAPTGAGKTDASLLWASQQIMRKRAERLIIAMPTRFTSNALAVNVAESLSETGLYHSTAWYAKTKGKDEDEKKDVRQQHELARLLLTPITVCTIDHLLMSLTLTREDHHLIDFNLANSCLVIDEADFYDDFTMANIMFLLKVLHEWKVPVLLMSASLPNSVVSTINEMTGFDVKQIYQDDTDSYRSRFRIVEKRGYEGFEKIEDLIDLCIDKGNAIIYVNTIDKAMLCYQYVVKRVQRRHKDTDVYIYHSHFTEPDKQEKEKVLINALGREAWANGSAKGIAILTQIGEMSVNISADIMITDLCPIDRLIQRTGRLCRFDKGKIGELYLLIPYKNRKLYPAPYGKYDIKERTWQQNEFMESTNELIRERKYNSSELTSLLNSVYHGRHTFSIKALDNAKKLGELFEYNWLINPVEKTDKKQEDTTMWKSRDVAPQGTVFVSPPEKGTMFWNEYLQYKMKSGIDLPVYQLENARKLHRVDMVEISIIESLNDKEFTISINVVRGGFYDSNIGLDLLKPSNEDNFL